MDVRLSGVLSPSSCLFYLHEDISFTSRGGVSTAVKIIVVLGGRREERRFVRMA